MTESLPTRPCSIPTSMSRGRYTAPPARGKWFEQQRASGAGPPRTRLLGSGRPPQGGCWWPHAKLPAALWPLCPQANALVVKTWGEPGGRQCKPVDRCQVGGPVDGTWHWSTCPQGICDWGGVKSDPSLRWLGGRGPPQGSARGSFVRPRGCPRRQKRRNGCCGRSWDGALPVRRHRRRPR